MIDEKYINDIINNKIKYYRNILISFIAGFVIFISLGIFLKETITIKIMEYLYPPKHIYKSIVSIADSDDKIKNLNLDKFPKLKKEIPAEVWDAIVKQDKDEYDKLMKNHEFTNSLKDMFYKEMQYSFCTYKPVNKPGLIEEVERAGKIELHAELTEVASNYHLQNTTCNINFNHDKLHCIIVFPESSNQTIHYPWLRCSSSGWPNTELCITFNEKDVSEIKVVGVQRDGILDSIELRLSKEAMKALEVPGWYTYKARGSGKFHISRAYF